MPELAEVEYYRTRWNPGLGLPIRAVAVHPQARVLRGVDLATLVAGLTGARLVASEAQAKQMVFRSDRGGWLGLHLGMSGELLTAAPGHVPDRHEHLCLATEGGPVLVLRDPRMFGRVQWHPGPEAPAWWTTLAPAILADAFTEAYLAAGLRRRARRPLKALLLQQDLFPGIGNWMADEVLWRARLHPEALAGTLGPAAVRRLHTTLRAVCRDALAVIGTTWGDPPDTWLFNHRWRDGGVCPRDRTPLRRQTVGGRTTCYCPRCQGAAK